MMLRLQQSAKVSMHGMLRTMIASACAQKNPESRSRCCQTSDVSKYWLGSSALTGRRKEDSGTVF